LEKQEIKVTALGLDLPLNKVKKLLITAKAISYPEMEQIQQLLNSGKTMAKVQEVMRLSRAAINTYLPYNKVIYKRFETSQNAERVAKYRERKAAVQSFHTSSGLPFSYTFKIGHRGSYTKELLIDRRENSKSLASAISTACSGGLGW